MERKIAICIVTYMRPSMLADALESIAKLTFTKNDTPRITVIVVDNDPEGSAQNVFERFSKRYTWTLEYHREERRGIPFARNTAIRHALKRGDHTAFIDDDEYADTHWLDEMISVLDEFDADVVRGPVLSVLPADAPDWIQKGNFFNRPRYKTGTVMNRAITGNVLFTNSLVADLDEPFDPRFALSGGEDVHFFSKLHKAGHRIVWADDAVVFEKVPESRVHMSWILRRTYRSSITFTVSQMILKSPLTIMPRRLGVAFARIILGILIVLTAGMWGKHVLTRGLMHVAIGCGTVAAFLGIRYREYAVVHGR